jgi:hypothetical protein
MTALLVMVTPIAAANSGIQITDAWARATIAESKVSAIYMNIRNTTAKPLTIQKLTCDMGTIEIHETVTKNGIAHMRQIKNLAVPAGAQVSLRPGGLHAMIMGLKQPLTAGQTLKLRVLTDTGAIVVKAEIRQP